MSGTESVVVGGGCFWCTEAVFQRVEGVVSAVPGYAGGHVPRPTYEQADWVATREAFEEHRFQGHERVAHEEVLHIRAGVGAAPGDAVVPADAPRIEGLHGRSDVVPQAGIVERLPVRRTYSSRIIAAGGQEF